MKKNINRDPWSVSQTQVAEKDILFGAQVVATEEGGVVAHGEQPVPEREVYPPVRRDAGKGEKELQRFAVNRPGPLRAADGKDYTGVRRVRDKVDVLPLQ